MPAYEYKCPTCKGVYEVYCAMKDRNEPVSCENYDCADYRLPVMKRILSPTRGVVKNPAVPSGRRGSVKRPTS